jgi:hypothetical protein
MSDSSIKRSIRITFINSTFIVIINWANIILTSNVTNTIFSMTSILSRTFIGGIDTT